MIHFTIIRPDRRKVGKKGYMRTCKLCGTIIKNAGKYQSKCKDCYK